MKKLVKAIALLMALVLCLSVTAFAANVKNELASITDVAEGAVVEFVGDGAEEEKIKVEYTSDSITAGGFYLVMVLADDGSEVLTPTEGNILYIEQVVGDDDHSVAFTVYASKTEGSIEDSVVMLYGLDESVKLGTIKSEVKIGDANGDGVVNAKDLTRLAKYLVGDGAVSSKRAADANGDDAVDAKDLTRLAKYLVGTASLGKGE